MIISRHSIVNLSIFLFVLHFVMAIILKLIFNINMSSGLEKNTVDSMWQVLPIELLRNEMLISIWNLHSQPPLFNAYIGLLLKLFYPYHVTIMHFINITMGSFMSGMCMQVIYIITRNKILSFIATLLIILNPSMFLYEAYMLYSLQTAFCCMLALYLLAIYSVTNRIVYAYLFIVTINILILLRSMYHPIMLLFFVPIICLVSKRNIKQVLIATSLISMLPLLWYMKNYYQYGFFGSTSWYGMSLWKTASVLYIGEDIMPLVAGGELDAIILDVPNYFAKPSEYIKYGYIKSSSISALNRNDHNNINIPDISSTLYSNAIRLIRYDPWHYLTTILNTYIIYAVPTSLFRHLNDNRRKIIPYVYIYEVLLQGLGLYILLILPACISICIVVITKSILLSKFRITIDNGAIILFMLCIIAYATLISCCVEAGENNRFRFEVEMIIWIFIISILHWSVIKIKSKFKHNSKL